MNADNFPIFTLVIFLAVVVLMPIISFVFLDKARALAIEISDKQFIRIFIVEVLIWLLSAFFIGLFLIIFLAVFIGANSLTEVKGTRSVRSLPIIVGFGIIASQALLGFGLHKYTKAKLLSTVTS